MAYLGRSPQVGNYVKLDNISSSFNGATTTFALTSGSVAYTPGSPTQMIVSIDGVIQEPLVAYTLSGSNITFTSAPSLGSTFFAVALGDVFDIGVPSDGTVGTAKIQDSAITFNKLNANTAHYDRNQTFTKAQRGAVLNLGTVSTNTTFNFANSNHYELTLGGSITLGNPTGLVAGQGGSIILKQDVTGSRTVSYGSYWKFPNGTAPVLSTAGNSVDRIDYLVANTTYIHAVEALDVS